MIHLTFIAVMALVAQGAYAAQQEGMILHSLSRLFAKLPTWTHKPTHTCPVCMVSVWGVPALFYLAHFGGLCLDPWLLPVYLLAAAGLNWILPG